VEFRGWYHAFNAALGNFTHDPAIEQSGLAAKMAFAAYVREQIARVRREPDDTLLSQLALQSALDEDEIIDDVRVTIFGGLETTSALLGNCLWALLIHPQAYAAVTTDPSQQINAIEETFRWESPVQTATRHLTRPAVISGVKLPAGETLQCLLGAANRDPAYFSNPDVFDIERPNAKDHLAFGTGKHFCIGAALARLEAQIGLRALLERLPHLRLTHAEDYPAGHEFRAPSRLRIAWDTQRL
jgi:cytochrome P450